MTVSSMPREGFMLHFVSSQRIKRQDLSVHITAKAESELA